MKRILNVRICIDELPEGAYLAYVESTDANGIPKEVQSTSDSIYGNTLKQIRQRIGKRLEKLIVEED